MHRVYLNNISTLHGGMILDVSDGHYGDNLFDRDTVMVNGTALFLFANAPHTRYELVQVDEDGKSRVLINEGKKGNKIFEYLKSIRKD